MVGDVSTLAALPWTDQAHQSPFPVVFYTLHHCKALLATKLNKRERPRVQYTLSHFCVQSTSQYTSVQRGQAKSIIAQHVSTTEQSSVHCALCTLQYASVRSAHYSTHFCVQSTLQ